MCGSDCAPAPSTAPSLAPRHPPPTAPPRPQVRAEQVALRGGSYEKTLDAELLGQMTYTRQVRMHAC